MVEEIAQAFGTAAISASTVSRGRKRRSVIGLAEDREGLLGRGRIHVAGGVGRLHLEGVLALADAVGLRRLAGLVGLLVELALEGRARLGRGELELDLALVALLRR